MKLEDFGYDPKTKIHNPQLTTAENRFLGILWVDHFGADNKISAEELAVCFRFALDGITCSEDDVVEILNTYRDVPAKKNILEEWKRDVRYMQSHLLMRHENLPILSRSGYGGGYWFAETKEEIDQFFNAFRKRGMHGIVKASRASKVRFANIMQQLTFEFEDLVDKDQGSGARGQGTEDRGPAPYVVVDALLEKMMKNPEQFSSELRKLGAKFGSVLLPKERYEEIKTASARLQELVTSMEGV